MRCELRRSLFAALMAVSFAAPLSAHEFWIAPSSPAGTENVSADLRVGQDLSGTALPYLDRTIAAQTHWAPDGAAASVNARLGDSPAMQGIDMAVAGLHRLTVETQPAYVVFDTFPEFRDYLAYEGLAGLADDHLSRGLPKVEIAEEYFRHARALVQVGPVANDQSDSATGLPFELVAVGNPFAPDLDTVEVDLTWNGAPWPDTQIALFHLPAGGTAPGDTVRVLQISDAQGRAAFAAQGPGRYLFNAVKIDPADGPGSVVWQSRWASLYFELETAE